MVSPNYIPAYTVGPERHPAFPRSAPQSAEPAAACAALHRYKPLDRRRRHVIYLAAPIPAYDMPAYDAALSVLHRTYPAPRHVVVSARETFGSTQDWQGRYREVLSSVTGLYLVSLDGYVGAGVFEECAHLTRDRGISHVWAFARKGSLHRVGALVALSEDMWRFPYHVRLLSPAGEVLSRASI